MQYLFFTDICLLSWQVGRRAMHLLLRRGLWVRGEKARWLACYKIGLDAGGHPVFFGILNLMYYVLGQTKWYGSVGIGMQGSFRGIIKERKQEGKCTHIICSDLLYTHKSRPTDRERAE